MADNLVIPTAPGETILPVLSLSNVVVLPGLVAPLLVERPVGTSAVESAAPQNLPLALFWSRQPDAVDQTADVGVSARILRLVKLPTGQTQLVVQGVNRIRKLSVVAKE